jgi:2-phospho-L-lactate/phosphoenolpyruvate guanylyltransferase
VNAGDIWAVVPVKETTLAKQRLGNAVPLELKPRLALAMAEDLLAALAAAPALRGIVVVTIDPAVNELAGRYGARVLAEGARDGQTGAVRAAAHALAREDRAAMLTVAADVPLVTAEEIWVLIEAHDRTPDFLIAPAHDGRGSNAVLCAPPELVALQFGDDSFVPHVEAARRLGLEPKVIRLAGIGLDIDRPRDLAAFLQVPSRTRTRALLEESGIDAQEFISRMLRAP